MISSSDPTIADTSPQPSVRLRIDDSDSRPCSPDGRPRKMFKVETQPVDTTHISATVTFTLHGRSYCSRAVCCSPEPDPRTAGVKLFSSLPSHILRAIFEEVCRPDVPSDPLHYQLSHLESEQKAFDDSDKQRRANVLTLKAVCRLFRYTALPIMYSVAHYRPDKPAADVEALLTARTPFRPPSPPNCIPDDDEELASTVGAHVKTLIYSSSATADITSISTWTLHTPNLETVLFTRDAVTSDVVLRDLARNLSPSIRHICGLNLQRSGTPTTDHVLSLLNFAQDLKTFSVKHIYLHPANAARLLFILSLNSRLTSKSAAGEGGLTSLSFGLGCHISRTFLEGLHEAAPHLLHLHLGPGCLLTEDGSANNNDRFDLGAFVASVVRNLETWSFVFVSGLQVKGNVEDVSLSCPKLRAAYIRADHISYGFFRQLICFDEERTDSEDFATIETEDASTIITSVLPSSKLEFLRIHHTHGAKQAANHYVELDSRAKIAEFARATIAAEDSGIVWPTSEGSQKDLFTRLEWIIQSRAKQKLGGSDSEMTLSSRDITADSPRDTYAS